MLKDLQKIQTIELDIFLFYNFVYYILIMIFIYFKDLDG